MSREAATDRVIKRILSHFGGKKRQLALALNISAQAVQQWTRIPTEHVLRLEELTGIPRHEMRPDVYPPPTSKKARRPLAVAA